MELTPGERTALENLARKATGEDVGWINIADARALAEKGLCDRDRQGWHINADGLSWLQSAPASPSDPVLSSPIQFRP